MVLFGQLSKWTTTCDRLENVPASIVGRRSQAGGPVRWVAAQSAEPGQTVITARCGLPSPCAAGLAAERSVSSEQTATAQA